MSINRNLSKLAANVTTSGEVPFTSVSSKPTTVSGYGITDAFDGAFSSLTGTPTTVSGYGITDAIKADSSVAAQPVRFYYASTSNFPSATTWHGAVAHSHADGAMYFAHGGSWVKMANDSDLPVVGTDAQAYDANLTSFVSAFTLPTTDGSANQVLKTDGSGNLSFVDQASGGGGGASLSTINVTTRSVSSNTTIAATESAFSVGPVEIADGVTLTVASGGRHVIL